MKYCRIYWLLLSTVCMNSSVHSSDVIQSQNIPSHVNPPASPLNSSFNEETKFEFPRFMHLDMEEVNQDNYFITNGSHHEFQNNRTSFEDETSYWESSSLISSDIEATESTDRLLSILETTPSASPFLNTSGNQLSNIFTTDNGYNGVQNNSILYTSSTFAINSQPESRNISELDNNVSTASSQKKRKRKKELDEDIFQQNLSKKSKKDTLIQKYPPLASSNSTLSSMEKKALYEKMLKETQTQFEAAFNLQGQYHHYESFKVIFSKLLPNIKENYSCEYDRGQIYVWILRRLGYTIREIALLSQIDGYLGLGYLPPRAPSSFERIVQGLKLTDDQLTLVTNHISSHQNTNEYRLKPKIGWIYKQYKQIFTKRRTHSKLVSQMK